MTWGADIYLELRKQRYIKQNERGAMPLPENVAAAMEKRATVVETTARSLGDRADKWMLVEPGEMRQLAQEVREGTDRGRETFRQQLLDLLEVKRGTRQPAGITQYLPADVLAPFSDHVVSHDQGAHAGRFLDALAETKELIDPSLRR